MVIIKTWPRLWVEHFTLILAIAWNRFLSWHGIDQHSDALIPND
ncbi:hypothetical protein [Synechocystis salina]|nr:hypothetical protein [Synechocystis salina]